MNRPIDNNPHATSVGTQVHVAKDGAVETELTIMTDLELDGTHPDHKKADVDKLIEDTAKSMGSHDRAVVKQNPDGGTF